MKRDSQRSKVYTAERKVFLWNDYKQVDVSTVELYRARVKEIMATEWMRSKYHKASVTNVYVEWSRMQGARANGFRIRTGSKSAQEWVLLHELAHVITFRVYGASKIQGHGWEFCAVYLDLVGRFICAEAREALRLSFKEFGVRYTAPRKRAPLSPELREAACQRLAVARAKREENKRLEDARVMRHRMRGHASYCGANGYLQLKYLNEGSVEALELHRAAHYGDGGVLTFKAEPVLIKRVELPEPTSIQQLADAWQQMLDLMETA